MKVIVERTEYYCAYVRGRILDDTGEKITDWAAVYNRDDDHWELFGLDPISIDAAEKIVSAKVREYIGERLSTWKVPSKEDICEEQEL